MTASPTAIRLDPAVLAANPEIATLSAAFAPLL